jgi:hypothetical protein
MSENQAELSCPPGCACACLKVKYYPEDIGNGMMRERWVCELCESEFARGGLVQALENQIVSMTATGSTGSIRPKSR